MILKQVRQLVFINFGFQINGFTLHKPLGHEGRANSRDFHLRYGFIGPEDGSKDVFVHISAVERAGLTELSEGQRLSFELERGQQGRLSAVDLKTV